MEGWLAVVSQQDTAEPNESYPSGFLGQLRKESLAVAQSPRNKKLTVSLLEGSSETKDTDRRLSWNWAKNRAFLGSRGQQTYIFTMYTFM